MAEVVGIAEAREMTSGELSLWAAHLKRRRREDRIIEDLRFLGLVNAVAAFGPMGRGKFDAKMFFPSVFDCGAGASGGGEGAGGSGGGYGGVKDWTVARDIFAARAQAREKRKGKS